jgi:flavorubredoxin
MVRTLDIETIAPQHGAVFQGRPMVEAFLSWAEQLECGLDLMQDVYRVPG